MRGARRAAAAGLALLMAGGVQASHAASSSTAARPMVVSDPRGDVLQGTRGDLVRLTLATRGHKVRSRYTPQAVVVRIDLADTIDRSGLTRYELSMVLPGCSRVFRLYVNPGNPADRGVSCHTGASDLTFTMDRKPTLGRTTITWVVPFDDFPDGALSPGQTIRKIRAWSGTTGPDLSAAAQVAGALPGQLVDNDELATSRPFILR